MYIYTYIYQGGEVISPRVHIFVGSQPRGVVNRFVSAGFVSFVR